MVMHVLAGVLIVAMAAMAEAQTPQPFPNPSGSPPPPRQAPPPQPPPGAKPGTTPPGESTAALQPVAPDLGGIPLYPNAAYLGSYDAGRGQRFHLYGVKLPYADAVAFYRTALKDRGDELYQSPPTHQFEIGRYREGEMSFPPSVTIKDYTWGGSAGYMHPKLGTQPERFPTVIQIVPPPAAR
jgi:hypothetical protein